MCTNKRTITRFYPLIGYKSYQVNCGKCAECLSLKRSALVTDALLTAETASSVCLATFTYSDECLPVATCCLDVPEGSVRELAYSRGISKNGPFYPNGPNGHYQNCLHQYEVNGLYYNDTCTPFREDLKNTFKRFRIAFKRKYGVDSKFRYCAFPELGEKRGRPHFHAIIFDLENEAIPLMRNAWIYGSSDFATPETKYGRSPELSDFIKTSKYISKYVSKGPFGRFSYLQNFVQQFRKQRSIKFGVSDFKLEILKTWYCSPFVPANILFERSKKIIILGEECVISPSLYKKLYYEKRQCKISLHQRRRLREAGVSLSSSDVYFSPRPTETARKMFNFSRKLALEGSLRTADKFDSRRYSYKDRMRICQEISCVEKSQRQDSEVYASSIILSQLKFSKDGE